LNPELVAIARFRLFQVVSSENWLGVVDGEAIVTSENHMGQNFVSHHFIRHPQHNAPALIRSVLLYTVLYWVG
jgi:hypothetical protein